MKKTIFITLCLFIPSMLAGAFFEFFHARSETGNVRIEWKTGEERDVTSFIIERKSPNSSFLPIATVQPKGNNSFYSYLDENAYKPNDMIFIYRIKIVTSDNNFSLSKEIAVSHSVSGIKRTWGSIKAMFR